MPTKERDVTVNRSTAAEITANITTGGVLFALLLGPTVVIGLFIFMNEVNHRILAQMQESELLHRLNEARDRLPAHVRGSEPPS